MENILPQQPITQNSNENIPVATETQRPTGRILPLALVLIFVLAGLTLYFGYNYYTLKSSAGTLVAVPEYTNQIDTPTPNENPVANWINYSNETQHYTFSYPPTWKLERRTETEQSNNIVILTKDKAKITIYANLDGIGGHGRDFEGTRTMLSGVSLFEYNTTSEFDSTRSIGLTDKLTGSLGVFEYQGKTYSIILNYPLAYDQTETGASLQTEFHQIQTTFKFLAQTGGSNITTTPTPILLDKTYRDQDYGYSISYPKSWTFSKTYGKDIPKAGTTDILSGIDLANPYQASIVVNVLDAHGESDIAAWITKYDLNYPKNGTKETVRHAGIPTVNYLYNNAPGQINEALYFISGSHAYRIYTMEKGDSISETTGKIIAGFKP